MQSLKIIQGSDQPTFIQLFTQESDGSQTPFDLTDATEIKAIFVKQDNTKLEMKKTDPTPGIVVENAIAGKIKIDWTEAITATLKKGENLSFEVEVIINTKTYIVQFEKILSVKGRLI